MPRRKYSNDSNSSKENEEEPADYADTQTTMNRPFKRKIISQAERKTQQRKALVSLSKILNVSDKYAKAWEKQKEKRNEQNTTETVVDSKNSYFTGSLREYQLIGVKWLETLFFSGINGILADEMGLGKTIQIIAFLSRLQSQKVKGMHIISVPLSTVPNWMTEFKRFAPKFPVIKFHGTLEEREVLWKNLVKASLQPTSETEVYPIVIVPHNYMAGNMPYLLDLKFVYLIIDEGHRIKNYESQMSQFVRKIQCRNKILLTGTPLQNDMKELWSLFNFIMPAIFTKVGVFNELIQAEDLATETIISSNLKESTTVVQTIQRLIEPFMLRRLKKDVLKENLPLKSVRVYCTMTPTQIEMYTAALEKNLAKLKYENEVKEVLDKSSRKLRAARKAEYIDADDDQPVMQKKLPTSMIHANFCNPIMLYRRIVNHPYLINAPLQPGTPYISIDEKVVTESGKMRVLDALLTRLLERGHKVLIYSTLVIMIDLIQDYLQMRDIPHARLTGSDSLEARWEQIESFNNDPSVGVFLVSTRAGGQGINLTAADTVIFYDSDWNPHADNQAQARCHRIGQTKPVMVYTLISSNSIDEYILQTSDLKLRLEKAVMLDEARARQNVETIHELLAFLKSAGDKALHPNGLTLSDAELDALLDRSELLKEMEGK